MPSKSRKNEDRIRALVENVPLFAGLDPEHIDLVTRRSALRSLAAEHVLPGDSGRIGVVETGEILFVQRTDGHDRVVGSYVDGDSFGELDLIGGDSGYVIRTGKPTVLCLFPDRGTAEEMFEKHPRLGAAVARRLIGAIADRTRAANTLVSERAPWIEGLRDEIMTDKLTGLRNSTFLREEAPERLRSIFAGDADTERAALFMVKPDNFKRVNDTYGHDVGDEVLRRLAACVGGISESAIRARFKGDVFCVIPEGIEEAESLAVALLERIRGIDVGEIVGEEAFNLTATSVLVRVEISEEGIARGCDAALSRIMTLRESGGDRHEWID